MSTALRMATVLIVVLVVLLTLIWFFQRRLIYLPFGVPRMSAATVFEGGADVRLRTEDGLQLTAWWAPAIGSARGVTVLVAPGNAGSRALRVPLARALTGRGFNVLLVEYRGYGGNPGTPTEDGLAADVRAAYRYLTEDRGVNPHRLVLFGESLGGAVLTRLATERPVGGLVLRSPFTSLADAGARAYPSCRSECSCVSGIRCASRSTRYGCRWPSSPERRTRWFRRRRAARSRPPPVPSTWNCPERGTTTTSWLAARPWWMR